MSKRKARHNNNNSYKELIKIDDIKDINNYIEKLIELIKKRKKEKGLTIERVADSMYLDYRVLSEILNEKRELSVRDLMMLCVILKIDTTEIMDL